MKIAVTGKYGLLSLELQKLYNIISLSSTDYDITSPNIIKKLQAINPDVIIHAGAVTDSSENPISLIRTNIIGTAHISEYCIKNNKRLVYISTDYIYTGTSGNYKESDPVYPHNEYAWTKLGGECSVRQVPNHLIIRTSFGGNDFPNEFAWDNQIVSKDYVDIIAPKILKSSLSNITGILNIGTEPKTVLDYVSRRNIIKGKSLDIGKNFSLNLDKYEQTF